MNASDLLWLAFALWLAVVLTGCSYMAMGIELRSRGVPIKWWSFSFNLKTRIQTASEVISKYQTLKRERQEFPLFAWAMAVFGAGILLVPVSGLLIFLFTGR